MPEVIRTCGAVRVGGSDMGASCRIHSFWQFLGVAPAEHPAQALSASHSAQFLHLIDAPSHLLAAAAEGLEASSVPSRGAWHPAPPGRLRSWWDFDFEWVFSRGCQTNKNSGLGRAPAGGAKEPAYDGLVSCRWA